MTLDVLYQKIRSQERLTLEEGLRLYLDAPWPILGQLAEERRTQRIGGDWASYTLFRIINYTNQCEIDCAFCSFKRHADDPGVYVMDEAEVLQKTREAADQGVKQIFLQGGVHPNLPLDYYLGLLRAIKREFGFHIRGFSPVEIRHFARISGLDLATCIARLKEAGLDSVPGAGAEILSERVRQALSPKKCSPQEWVSILAECHRQGLRGSANIVVGSIETPREILEHLELVRRLQDQTHGLDSFIPWTFQPQTKDFILKQVPPQDYLKLLSLARIYLDNIENIEVSVMVLGPQIGQLALQLGANDISSPVFEEKVLRNRGITGEEQARNLIRGAGLRPLLRDFNYRFETNEDKPPQQN